MRLLEVKTIKGCEARGDAESAYLTRLTLVGGRLGGVYVHLFHRSDGDELHDHPWGFVSVILWRGYVEVTPAGRRRMWPGWILVRKAAHRHRVELVGGRRALTLVFVGPKVREWGFWAGEQWTRWVEYFQQKGCQ